MILLLVALAGGAGAGTRFWLDTLVARRNHTGVPLGTVLINVSGSLLLGLLTGWVLAHDGASSLRAVAGTGFLGGYTTFSTASVEGVRLIRSGRPWVALAHAGGMLTLGLAGAGLGLWLMAG
ncbi:MAG: CrcB family protein [Actinobacteria bacterium]|nr:CrcB family protein [Actinomycetota bacterium]MCG2803200.1 CrcB family protein [Cellulomonas sp.]